jgi:hypothetical protein
MSASLRGPGWSLPDSRVKLAREPRMDPMSDSPRKVNDLLSSPGGSLAALLRQGRKLQTLERRLHSVLDPALAAEVRVAALEGDCLVLVTARAGVAARLRTEARDLARELRNVGVPSVHEIRVRVAPAASASQPVKTTRALPASATQALERFAKDQGFDDLASLLASPAGKSGKDRA